MDLNFFLCQRRGLSWMVLSLSQVQCYLAMVPNPDKLSVATDPQTLVVDIMAMWYDSHLLCEFLNFATLIFHDFPPLVFGFGDYAFCICTCWWQMWLLCRQNPLLCHVPKMLVTWTQLWLNHLCSCYTHGQHFVLLWRSRHQYSSYLGPPIRHRDFRKTALSPIFVLYPVYSKTKAWMGLCELEWFATSTSHSHASLLPWLTDLEQEVGNTTLFP